MAEALQDRRRTARVPLSGADVHISLATSTTVQVIDISQSGVLLSSTQPLEVGRRAQLRTRIGNDPLTVQVEIRRSTNGRGSEQGTRRLGAEFIGLDEENRRRIERFLRVEN